MATQQKSIDDKMKRNIIIFDDNEVRKSLLPLTFTRPIAELRVGITTITEKWKLMLGNDAQYSYLTVPYLKAKYGLTAKKTNLMVAGHVIPTPEIAAKVLSLKSGEALMTGEMLIAFNGSAADFDNRHYANVVFHDEKPLTVLRPYDVFTINGEVLKADFAQLTAGRESQQLPPTCTVIGDRSLVFLEEGATVDGATLNTRQGPIYIGKDVEVMEGACVRGPFAAGQGSKVRIGAKVYGATTLGPQCKIGGEVENCVFIGYSNKAHDGYLGDAVVGAWCNIGGGTTASNLKNDYSEVKLWNYATQRFARTGLQFCGPVMGDHCKTGVNCMLNTATVLGVGVNVHGSGFPRPFVASFQEGGNAGGFHDVSLKAFFAMAERVMARRGIELDERERAILTAVYDIAERKYK